MSSNDENSILYPPASSSQQIGTGINNALLASSPTSNIIPMLDMNALVVACVFTYVAATTVTAYPQFSFEGKTWFYFPAYSQVGISGSTFVVTSGILQLSQPISSASLNFSWEIDRVQGSFFRLLTLTGAGATTDTISCYIRTKKFLG